MTNSRRGAKYRIPQRGRIAPGARADLLLFDPATVRASRLERGKDLSGGGARMIRLPQSMHRIWVNGTEVHGGRDYVTPMRVQGHVLRRFSA